MQEEEIKRRIEQIMGEKNVDYLDALDLYMDERQLEREQEYEAEELRVQGIRDRLLSSKSPKGFIYRLDENEGRNPLVAMQIAKRHFAVESHHIIKMFTGAGLSKYFIACDKKITRHDAERIYHAIEDDDTYIEEEVELIVVEHLPFDIRIEV